MTEAHQRRVVLCIGAGPASLTAAYHLLKNAPEAYRVLVLEKHPGRVGGISRTERHNGYLFDVGGHRFFSKSAEIEALWREMLGDDLLTRRRSSRILYGGKFYSYPLKPFEVLKNLGPLESARCVLSYLAAALRPVREPRTFEDWVSNRFGRRLFSMFFKTYTEKVWGMSCREISADWAAQRINNLSMRAVLSGALRRLLGQPDRSGAKTLIEAFRYPRRGPGMMWERCAELIVARGGDVRMGATVTGIAYDASATACPYRVDYEQDGQRHSQFADVVISSMPLRRLVENLSPRPADDVLAAASGLRYRDFIVVAVMLLDRGGFDDQWIYIHDPGVQVGRVQNFKAWSSEMIPEGAAETTCYGMEYFCFEGDGLWTSSDEALKALAVDELCRLGLARKEDVLDAHVIREPKAYPVYDDQYQARVARIAGALRRDYPGLYVVGRNGMHKYNNQDHAMMTGLLTARNLLSGREDWDVWAVNQDAEYLESTQPKVPQALR